MIDRHCHTLSAFPLGTHQNGSFLLEKSPVPGQVPAGGEGAPSHLSIFLPYAVEAAKDMQLFFLVASTTAGNEGLSMFGALMLFVCPSVK